MSDIYKIPYEIVNFRISKSKDCNIGEILVIDYDDGLLTLPSFFFDYEDPQSSTGLYALLEIFKIPRSITARGGFDTLEQSLNQNTITVPIKYSGSKLNDMLEKSRKNNVIRFGDFFDEFKPTEKLNAVKEQGYFIIIHF